MFSYLAFICLFAGLAAAGSAGDRISTGRSIGLIGAPAALSALCVICMALAAVFIRQAV